METQENNIISDSNEKLSQQQQISDLKLQLNACQQTIASLELKVRQKEEVIIKTQADMMKQTELLKEENKKLREQLKENTETTDLQEALKAAEEKGNKALNELHDIIQKDQKMNQILEEYERELANQQAEFKKLSDLHEIVKGNLATLETAFHDVIQKYERAKGVIEGFRSNEEIYKENIETMEKTLKMEAQRYESLKAHATKQIEKANKENTLLRHQYDALELKQNAIIKRMEIKTAALEISLEQKAKECADLAALCDEVTGKKV